MARLVRRNGKDLAEVLRDRPAGTYALESLNELPALSEEEDYGLRQALTPLRAGRGRSAEQVREAINAAMAK